MLILFKEHRKLKLDFNRLEKEKQFKLNLMYGSNNNLSTEIQMGKPAMVRYICDPSTGRRTMSSRPAWAT
jgi:hypothetical protein